MSIKDAVTVRIITNEDEVIKVVAIHKKSFKGFFLTFLGEGFLSTLYSGFVAHKQSGIYGAFCGEELVGFLAYSTDISDFYNYLIKNHVLTFAWYGMNGVLRKPSIIFRMIRALLKPKETKRTENYVELSSIAVLPTDERHGVGKLLVNELIKCTDFTKLKYIKLETDADNNDKVNLFYQKQGFVLNNVYITNEGRKMNEYRYKYYI